MHSKILSAVSLALISGSAAAQQTGFERQVEQEVTAAVHAFFNGFSSATCENGDPVSSLAKDNTIYVMETDIYRIPHEEYEQGVRQRACNWTKHDGGLERVVVEAHAPNVATAAWIFQDIITRKDGSVRPSKGAVMQTWVKEADGWKIAATKSSEDNANAVVEPSPSK